MTHIFLPLSSAESSHDQLNAINGTLASVTSSAVSLGQPHPLTSCSSLPVSSSALHAPPQLKVADMININGISSAATTGNLLAASQVQVQPLTSSSSSHSSPPLGRNGSTPSSPATQQVSVSPQPLNGDSRSSVKVSEPLPPLSLVNTAGVKISEDGLTASVHTPNSPYPIQQGRH